PTRGPPSGLDGGGDHAGRGAAPSGAVCVWGVVLTTRTRGRNLRTGDSAGGPPGGHGLCDTAPGRAAGTRGATGPGRGPGGGGAAGGGAGGGRGGPGRGGAAEDPAPAAPRLGGAGGGAGGGGGGGGRGAGAGGGGRPAVLAPPTAWSR